MKSEEAIARASRLDSSPSCEMALFSDHDAPDAAPRIEKAPRLSPFYFSTEGMERSNQFAAWHNSFSPMLELKETNPGSTEFRGQQILWDLGGLVFSRIRTDDLAFASLSGHVRRDPLDHWTIGLLRSGTVRTDCAKRTFTAGRDQVQVHSLGREFTGEVSDCDILMLFVPRDFSHKVAAALGSAEFSTLETGMGRLFADYLLGVSRRLPMLTEADLPGLAAATEAMILACIVPSEDYLESAEEPITTVLLERARQFVQRKLLDPGLASESVRRELGISRTRLYNLFEPFGGVMHYIQHRRLRDAHSVLSDPNDQRRILEIAEQRGFSDGAEFSRAFKRAFGYSPSEVRKGGKDGLPNRPRHDAEDCPAEERLGMLLRRLHG